ncbi:hypothetical protein GCM10023084_39460 [Streptomyces lacrimifluminis]|uniref:Uncharacterized protein n=1 Tax=Streptomyces lacrimifluminis TaxID=1500077 RepID=A0A917L199_9ACTN|nr:hypothetical protein GCM10012282_41080 [Streptomyces lacrimifluminis]
MYSISASVKPAAVGEFQGAFRRTDAARALVERDRAGVAAQHLQADAPAVVQQGAADAGADVTRPGVQVVHVHPAVRGRVQMDEAAQLAVLLGEQRTPVVGQRRRRPATSRGSPPPTHRPDTRRA